MNSWDESDLLSSRIIIHGVLFIMLTPEDGCNC